MNRRSFLTGAASTAALAATGGVGAVAGGADLITAEDLAIAKTYKKALGDMAWRSGQVWFKPIGGEARLLGEVAIDSVEVIAKVTRMSSRTDTTTLDQARDDFFSSKLGLPYTPEAEPPLMIEESPDRSSFADGIVLIPEGGSDVAEIAVEDGIERFV